ncbi:MAG: hypothetical protein ACD_72C00426G0001 [uncultured bacterium]|nr:MAG: hypothetical protein ACD_72C00426G0001 [uncultured bacterium]
MVSLELGVVLMLLTVVLVGILIYGSFIAFIPALLLWLLAGLSGWKILVSFGLVVGIFCYTVFILLVAGLFNSFVTCAWMYLFMKMHHEGISSRVIHFLKKLFRR